MEIKIRYTWRRKSDNGIVQRTEYLDNIECGELLKVGVFMNPLYDLIARDLFTGWKDKNGQDIFKGDLISESGSPLYEVVWQAHSGQWIMQSLSEGNGYRQMAYDYAQLNYEIIGNIHEPAKAPSK